MGATGHRAIVCGSSTQLSVFGLSLTCRTSFAHSALLIGLKANMPPACVLLVCVDSILQLMRLALLEAHL